MPYDHSIYLQQVGSKTLGFDPGSLDGLDGPKTRKAFDLSKAARFGSKKAAATTPKGYPPRPQPTAHGKTKVFGQRGVKGGRSVKLGYFAPPYPMEFSWGGKVKRIGCHHLIKTPLENALKEIGKLGLAYIKKHGLDLYAGCYAPRKSRNGNAWSDHSWAIAIDLNPDANGNKQTWRPNTKGRNGTYQMPKKVISIFQKHGFQVGFKKGNNRRDMMHIAYVDRP